MARNEDDLTEDKALMGRLMKDLRRAAELGLLPQDGAKISNRGEFIVAESNVEEDENKKQRTYRYKAFPKTLHAWPDGHDAPISLVVKNAAEEANAVAAGWSPDPVHGPGGRIVDGAVVETSAVEEAEVRTFAAPGEVQPHEEPAAKVVAPKKAGKKK